MKERVKLRSSFLAALVVVSALGGTLAFAGLASADGVRLADASDAPSVEQVENGTETTTGETETETETASDHEYPNEDATVTTSPGVATTPSGDTTETTTTGQDGPGFGVIVALVALVAAALVVVRRQG